MLINKRGISPLIATVLIIGITIILVTTIAFWLIPLFGETTCESSCEMNSISLCSEVSTNLMVQNIDGSGDGSLDTTVVTNDGGGTHSYSLVYRGADGSTVGSIVEGSVGAYSSSSTSAEVTADSVDMYPFVTPEAGEGCSECREIQCSTMAASLV